MNYAYLTNATAYQRQGTSRERLLEWEGMSSITLVGFSFNLADIRLASHRLSRDLCCGSRNAIRFLA
jgi:hypothetical protein